LVTHFINRLHGSDEYADEKARKNGKMIFPSKKKARIEQSKRAFLMVTC
jgi:hypothetical protein